MHRCLFEHIVTIQVLLFKLRNYIKIWFKNHDIFNAFDETYQLYEITKTGTQMPPQGKQRAKVQPQANEAGKLFRLAQLGIMVCHV